MQGFRPHRPLSPGASNAAETVEPQRTSLELNQELENLFADNRDLLVLNRLMIMGLGAHEGRNLCRMHPVDKPSQFMSRPLQLTYNNFLRRVREAGITHNPEDPWRDIYLKIYESFLSRQGHDEGSQMFERHTGFKALLDRVIEGRHAFFENDEPLTQDDMAIVRMFDERVIVAADRNFVETSRELTKQDSAQALNLHPEILDAYAALPEWRPRKLPFVSVLLLENEENWHTAPGEAE